MKSVLSIVVLITINAGLCLAEDQSKPIPQAGSLTDSAHMLGLIRGDCKKCHPSEVSAWMKSTHFLSADLRLYMNTANTKKYADALKIKESQLLTTSVCADCHGTKAIKDSKVSVISGVSCEKCHGGSGGDTGWLNRHQSYHNSLIVPRTSETKEHRTERLQDCDQAGMVRSSNIYGLAKTCYTCHLVNNEELVAAGHKLASAFEFVSWSEGEVRHNFLLNRTKNAEAPSIWLEGTGRSVQERRRLKFVLGALAQLEMGLRARADSKSPVLIPQIGGMIAAANGKLMQVNGVAPTEEVSAVTMLVLPLMGTLFAPLPNDKETYTSAADKIAGYAKQFAEKQTGENLSALDALINTTPPHFSQQFKDKYLVPTEDK